MLGLKNDEIRFERIEHDKNLWSKLFEDEKRRINNLMDANLIGVYHIGSTAISGALAKPILDIAVAVADMSSLSPEKLESIGYIDKGENGVKGQRYFVKMIAPDFSTHHLHCFQDGSQPIDDLLTFRDRLNQHPQFVNEYNELKLRLSKEVKNTNEYTEGKTEFIKRILR